MKKCLWLAAALCTLTLSGTAYAGEFVRDEAGIWYRNDDGSWQTGWFLDADGSWYYFDQEGYAKLGWYTENGKTYFFRQDSGRMIADRTITLDGNVYTFDHDGVSYSLSPRYTGWMLDDVGWYYRRSDGSFLTDGWEEIEGRWFFFDSAGYMKTGLLEWNGVTYYLDDLSGAMVTDDSRVVNGVTYHFDAAGAGTVAWPYKSPVVIPPEDQKSELQKALDAVCDGILAQITNSSMGERQKAEAIYRWVRGNLRYSGHSATRDWVTEAYQGFRRRHGDCYTYFSVSQALLTRAGLPSIEVIRNTDNDHYWNMTQVDGVWYHFDTTPRSWGGWFCLLTDAQMAAYSAAHRGCFNFTRGLYPPSP